MLSVGGVSDIWLIIFYERFKNKDLMNLFKRLCTQNQQRKFDALWGIIDDMSAELLKSQASSYSRRSSTDLVVGHAKPFFSVD